MYFIKNNKILEHILQLIYKFNIIKFIYCVGSLKIDSNS